MIYGPLLYYGGRKMAVVRILGIDPAMNNCGWMLIKLDTGNVLRPTAPMTASWIIDKDTTGKHTYQHFQRIDGGTIGGDEKVSWFERIQAQADAIHIVVDKVEPDIIAIESQLDKGESRSPTGFALQHLILAPYFRPDKKYYRRFHIAYSDIGVPCYKAEFLPSFVVLLCPPRVQSVAHCERSTTGLVVVRRYKQLVPTDKRRLSQHEADAWFIGVHVGRFWASVLTNNWDKAILTEKERYVFLDGCKAMMTQEGEAWWNLLGLKE